MLLVLLYFQLSTPPSDPVFTTAAFASLSTDEDIQTLLGFGSWAHQTYKAMPLTIRANIFASITIDEPKEVFKTAQDPLEVNKDAILSLWIYFGAIWVVYFVHSYFVLGLYSYYQSLKTASSATKTV